MTLFEWLERAFTGAPKQYLRERRRLKSELANIKWAKELEYLKAEQERIATMPALDYGKELAKKWKSPPRGSCD